MYNDKVSANVSCLKDVKPDVKRPQFIKRSTQILSTSITPSKYETILPLSSNSILLLIAGRSRRFFDQNNCCGLELVLAVGTQSTSFSSSIHGQQLRQHMLFNSMFAIKPASRFILARAEDQTAGKSETLTISTHVLDTSVGKPAANVIIIVYRLTENDPKQDGGGQWLEINQSLTDKQGRIPQLLYSTDFQNGVYKLRFDIRPYFNLQNVTSFYPFIDVIVQCQENEHYHVPLLISPFGYSTYRGS
uniref:hydroxyisourate hydrolase n=1 Tax=Glossina pallidipes TaxID=7398 RepID=A0A1B0A2Y3_GLOPL